LEKRDAREDEQVSVDVWHEHDGRTTSKRLDLRFFCVRLLCLRKYFCAWLATCVGVRVVTKCREMPRQSPFPSFSRPARNRRCSSSVHGTPGVNNIQKTRAEIFDAMPYKLQDLIEALKVNDWDIRGT
jgi:hypothetical protein